MTRPIDDYMAAGDAAYRWGLSIETIKNRLKPSIKGNKEKIVRMVNEGVQLRKCGFITLRKSSFPRSSF